MQRAASWVLVQLRVPRLPCPPLLICWPPWHALQAVLPPIKASVTITGNCNDAIYGGLCLIDAKALGEPAGRVFVAVFM